MFERMRPTMVKHQLAGIALAGACLLTASPSGAEVITGLERYAGSSSTLSAVVTAITMVEPCEGEIIFREEVIESYNVVELNVSCSSDEDASRSVILRFDILEDGGLKPASFGVGG